MPGNLEAPRILVEHAYGVNEKMPENPYFTTFFGSRPSSRSALRGA
jgi:hypothetical protein